jgi:16S rRNA (guanine527-N7)-methyltransferase
LEKQVLSKKPRELLTQGLPETGIEPSEKILDSFISYLLELKKWNKAYNLTALKKDEDIVIKHFLDSLLYLRFIPQGGWSICDMGSGAGFPGIPIAIVRPELNIVLIEPSRKKTAFLRHIKRTLSLKNIEVIEARAEDTHRQFDIAMTRALFEIGELIKKAGHLLKRDGFFILNKGPKFEDEMQRIQGRAMVETLSVGLPLTSVQRNLIKVSLP